MCVSFFYTHYKLLVSEGRLVFSPKIVPQVNKPEPIMLKNLAIIPSRTSQKCFSPIILKLFHITMHLLFFHYNFCVSDINVHYTCIHVMTISYMDTLLDLLILISCNNYALEFQNYSH